MRAPTRESMIRIMARGSTIVALVISIGFLVPKQRYAENFLGMLHLGCCLILLRRL